MSKPRYIALFLAAWGIGFLFSRLAHDVPKTAEAPPVSVELLEQAYKRIEPFHMSLAEQLFTSGKGKGLLFVYRSDCLACDAQWKEFAKLSGNIPLLAISADDTPEDFASSLARTEPGAKEPLYYLPPGRLLTLRTWLRDHKCRFTGALPFVALTDGKGNCVMAWQGLTAVSAIEGVAEYIGKTAEAP